MVEKVCKSSYLESLVILRGQNRDQNDQKGILGFLSADLFYQLSTNFIRTDVSSFVRI